MTGSEQVAVMVCASAAKLSTTKSSDNFERKKSTSEKDSANELSTREVHDSHVPSIVMPL